MKEENSIPKCVHTFEVYKGKKGLASAKPNWCPLCGKVKTKEDESIPENNNSKLGN